MAIDEMKEVEEQLKSLYLEHPELNLQYPMTEQDLASISDTVHMDLLHLMNIPLDTDLLEKSFFRSNEDIAIYQHVRYLPALYHRQKFFELVYIMSGSCTNYFEDSSITLKEGDICVIAPNVTHAVSAFSDTAVVYNFLIRTSTFDTSFLGLLTDKDVLSNFFSHALYANEKNSYLLFQTNGDTNLQSFIHFMTDEYSHKYKYKDRMMNSLLNSFFVTLLRNHEQNVILPSKDGQKMDENLMYILNYIQSNYTHLTLSELAEFFNYSERQMARIIKDNTGMNFSEMIRELKLHKAADLLHNPDISIAEIMERVGYSDLSSFYRSFKTYYNITPVEYRKNL